MEHNCKWCPDHRLPMPPQACDECKVILTEVDHDTALIPNGPWFGPDGKWHWKLEKDHGKTIS